MAPDFHAAITILPQERLIVVVVRGPVDRDRFHTAMYQLWNHPDYPSSKLFLFDISQADLLFTPAQIQALKQEVRRNPQAFKGRGAMVTHTPMQTALGMIYNQHLPQGLEAEIFSTWEAACDFLGVSLETVAHLHP